MDLAVKLPETLRSLPNTYKKVQTISSNIQNYPHYTAWSPFTRHLVSI